MVRSNTRMEAVPAVLSGAQIESGILKLNRRRDGLLEVEIDEWDDTVKNNLDAIQKKVEQTLMDVFGQRSAEYKRYRVPPFFQYLPPYSGRPSKQHFVVGYTKAVKVAISSVTTAIEMLEEKLVDLGETSSGHALQAYQGLELHPEIERASSDLFRDEHYANAIEDAVKALNALVSLRSGIGDCDGKDLMNRVFSPDKPILCFNKLADMSDRNEQAGYMMLFVGAVVGLRNPRAHKLITDDPERALEFIAFISLLAKLLDGAKKAGRLSVSRPEP